MKIRFDGSIKYKLCIDERTDILSGSKNYDTV